MTRDEFLARFASIMAEYMEVMGEAQVEANQVAVDGQRLLAIIENLTTLVGDMHGQVVWEERSPLPIYN